MLHVGTQAFATRRLVCRRFVPEDLAAMHRNWAADPLVQREYGEPAYPRPEDARGLLQGYLRAYERPDVYRWAVALRESGENIGQIAFCRVYSELRAAEIEYCIGRAFQGRGYASEALEGLLRFAFTATEFVRLEAYHRAENIASGRVLQRSAMRPAPSVERFRREGRTPEGEKCYCVLREQFAPDETGAIRPG